MQEVEPLKLFRKIEDKENIKIIDVRKVKELKETGKIPSSKHICLDYLLEEILIERGYNKGDEIIMTCRSGGRSGQAVKMLESWGYNNVSNLVGGIVQWREDKLPIENYA